MQKAQFLAHWEAIPEAQSISPCPVPYKHEGSTYAEDGIRLTGSREFIDSVLSRLKDLLAFESGETRLQVVYKESIDRVSGRPFSEIGRDSWNCYIQVHRRGNESIMANRIFGY